jgi:ssDNA-binding Zn-finger/Zn-ribbon topoisomerase 1
MVEQRRTIGYVCPHCRNSVVAERSLFSLASGNMSLPCPCGKSSFLVDYTDKDEFELTVPCPSCGGQHHVRLSRSQLMGHKLLGFACPKTGIDSCYVGEEDAVFAALPRLEQTLDKQQERSGQEGTFLDENVMSEILGELKDIAARGGISCTCGCKRFSIDIHYSSVELRCAHCGGVLRLPAATIDDLTDLCAKSALTIHGN